MRFSEIEDFNDFLVIDVDMPHNTLIGQPWEHKNVAISSIYQ